MLNFAGIGIGMSFRDSASDGIALVQKGFSGLTDTISGVAAAGLGLGKMAIKMPSFGPMAGQIQAIANDYKITTTNTEAFGIAASKVTSRMLAGMDMTSKEMGHAKGMIAGIAYGMNTDVGTVTESFIGLKRANIDFTKTVNYGLGTFVEYEKTLEVVGISGKEFGAVLGSMGSQFKMQPKEIKKTLDSVTELGTKFDMGKDAVIGMAKNIQMMAKDGAELWAELGPEKTKQFLIGTEQLAIAFKNSGKSAEEAQQLATAVGSAMLKSRKGVKDLYSGLTGDLHPAMQVMIEGFGSAEAAFDTLQQDPAKLAKRLAIASKAIMKSAKSPQAAQAALARFQGQITQTFGPEMTALIGGSIDDTIKSFDATDKAIGKLTGNSGAFTKLGQAYEDGLTPAERLARATDQFRTRLKKLMGETDSQFLNRFNTSAKITGDKLAELAHREGPLGKTISLFVEFSNHGLGGVASKISKSYGPAMAVLIQQFGPILSQLPQIIMAFKALASPIVFVAAALAGLYEYFREVSNGGGVFSNFVDKMAKKIPGAVSSAFQALKEIAPTVLKTVQDLLVKVFDMINWGKVGEGLLAAGEYLWDIMVDGIILAGRGGAWLIKQFEDIDWDKVGKYVEKATEKIAGLAIKAIVYIVQELPNILYSAAKMAFKVFEGVFNGLEEALVKAFPGAATYIHGLFEGLKHLIIPIIAVIGLSMVAAAAEVAIAWAATATAFIADAAAMAVSLLPILVPIAAVAAAVYGLYKLFEFAGSVIRNFADSGEKTYKTFGEVVVDSTLKSIKNIDATTASARALNASFLGNIAGEFGKLNKATTDAHIALSGGLKAQAALALAYGKLNQEWNSGNLSMEEYTEQLNRLNAKGKEVDATVDAMAKTAHDGNMQMAASWGLSVPELLKINSQLNTMFNQAVPAAIAGNDKLSKIWKDSLDLQKTRVSKGLEDIAHQFASGAIGKETADEMRANAVAAGQAAMDALTKTFTDTSVLGKLRLVTIAASNSMADAVKVASEQSNKIVVDGTKSGAAAIEGATKNGQKGVDAVLATTIAQTGVSTEDSYDILKKMIGGNKDQIIANLNQIGTAYKMFLDKVATSATKQLLTDSKLAFGKYLDTSKQFWLTDMDLVFSMFMNSVNAKMTQWWSNLITQASNRGRELVHVLQHAMDGLNSAAGIGASVSVNSAAPATAAAASNNSFGDPLATMENLISNQTSIQTAEHKELISRLDILIESGLGKNMNNPRFKAQIDAIEKTDSDLGCC